jgi:hypothetical protein
MIPAQCNLSLVKGRHRYVFRYAEGRESDLLASLVALASDPASEFDWLDAAVLSYQMGQQFAHELESVAQLE